MNGPKLDLVEVARGILMTPFKPTCGGTAAHEAWKREPLRFLRNTMSHFEADDGAVLHYYGTCRDCFSTIAMDLGPSRAPVPKTEDEALAAELIR